MQVAVLKSGEGQPDLIAECRSQLLLSSLAKCWNQSRWKCDGHKFRVASEQPMEGILESE